MLQHYPPAAVHNLHAVPAVKSGACFAAILTVATMVLHLLNLLIHAPSLPPFFTDSQFFFPDDHSTTKLNKMSDGLAGNIG